MAMRCEWCGKTDELLESAVDSNGNEMELCVKCRSALKSNVCRVCGTEVNHEETLNGMCRNCLQLKAYVKFEEEQEELEEMEQELNSEVNVGTPLTEEDCKAWRDRVTKGINPDMLRRDVVAQHLWAMSKFIEVGIKDNNVIKKNTKDLLYIVRNDIDKILYKKTELHISGSPEEDSKIGAGKIAVSRGNVYLLEVQ